MSAETKTYEDKMTGVINHLVKEHATIRAGRANPAILDKVTVDYYGTAHAHQSGGRGFCGRGARAHHQPLGRFFDARH